MKTVMRRLVLAAWRDRLVRAAGVLVLAGAVTGLIMTPAWARHAPERRNTMSWTDQRGCHYQATIPSVAHSSVTAFVGRDQCGSDTVHGRTWMKAWGVCASGPTVLGNTVDSGRGTQTKTAGCPFGNLYMHKWGVQSYQWHYPRAGPHVLRRVWFTHIFGENNG